MDLAKDVPPLAASAAPAFNRPATIYARFGLDPAKGSDMHNTRAYTKVDATTLTYKVKKDGKDVGTGKVVISADAKNRTVTETNTGKDGKDATTSAVYDKQ